MMKMTVSMTMKMMMSWQMAVAIMMMTRTKCQVAVPMMVMTGRQRDELAEPTMTIVLGQGSQNYARPGMPGWHVSCGDVASNAPSREAVVDVNCALSYVDAYVEA